MEIPQKSSPINGPRIHSININNDSKISPPSRPQPYSKRGLLVPIAFCIVILGIASRRYTLLPSILQNYPGDALWAALVLTLWTFCCPKASLLTLATLTFATSIAVEFSQLYQAPWINQLRTTLLGRLIFGTGFDPIDIIAYAGGTLIGLCLVIATRRPVRNSR